jgi:hypothetical protein
METYKVKDHETLFDVAAKLYGDTALGVQELLTNNEITINDFAYGAEVEYQPGKIRKLTQIRVAKTEPEVYYQTRELQTIFDLAVQLYGSVSEGLPKLLANNTFDLSAVIPMGLPVKYNDGGELPEIVATDEIPGEQDTFNVVIEVALLADYITALVIINPIQVHEPPQDEPANLQDHVNFVYVADASISEAANAGDLVSTGRQITAVMVEAVNMAEFIEGMQLTSRSITEAANATELSSSGGVNDQLITETASPDDFIIVFISYLIQHTEAASAMENCDAGLGTGASVIESAAAAETSDAVYTLTVATSEGASAADTSNGTQITALSIAEAATASDTTDRGSATGNTVSESAAATDSPGAAVVFAASITEAAPAIATIDGIITAYITEAASASEVNTASRFIPVVSHAEAASASAVQNGGPVHNASITEAAAATETSAYTRPFTLWLSRANIVGETDAITAEINTFNGTEKWQTVTNVVTTTEQSFALTIDETARIDIRVLKNGLPVPAYYQGAHSNSNQLYLPDGKVSMISKPASADLFVSYGP